MGMMSASSNSDDRFQTAGRSVTGRRRRFGALTSRRSLRISLWLATHVHGGPHWRFPRGVIGTDLRLLLKSRDGIRRSVVSRSKRHCATPRVREVDSCELPEQHGERIERTARLATSAALSLADSGRRGQTPPALTDIVVQDRESARGAERIDQGPRTSDVQETGPGPPAADAEPHRRGLRPQDPCARAHPLSPIWHTLEFGMTAQCSTSARGRHCLPGAARKPSGGRSAPPHPWESSRPAPRPRPRRAFARMPRAPGPA